MNKTERFVLKHDIEGFVIASIANIVLFVVIVVFMILPDHELKRKLFYLLLGTPLLALSLYRLL